MDLPRIASHTSLSIPQLELLHYNQNVSPSREIADSASTSTSYLKTRTTVSKRLLNAVPTTTTPSTVTPENVIQIPQITIQPPQLGLSNLPPSRRREEAQALRNLKKRVQQLRVVKANQEFDNDTTPIPIIKTNANLRDVPQVELDNRPKLLQRVSCHN